jgi:large subunit ribosomal protein L27e
LDIGPHPDKSFLGSYAVEVDFKPMGITPETVANEAKRTDARKQIKKLLEEKYKAGKNKWFFSKLRF